MTHWGYWKVKRKHKPKSVCDFAMSLDSFHFFKRPGFSDFQSIKEKMTRLKLYSMEINCLSLLAKEVTTFLSKSNPVILEVSGTFSNARILSVTTHEETVSDQQNSYYKAR